MLALLEELRRGHADIVADRARHGAPTGGPAVWAEVLGAATSGALQVLNARWRLRHATLRGRVQVRGRLRVERGGRVEIGHGVKIWSHVLRSQLSVPRGGVLVIGDGTFINTGTVISAHREVRIGARCQIGNLVAILDSDFHAPEDRAARPEPQPIVIEDDVWIAMRSVVLRGVRIGRGAVVGACSLVTQDVPAYTVVAGTPARVVRELARPAPA